MAGLYDALAKITDLELRQALKQILDQVGKLQGQVGAIGTLTKPLGSALDASGNLLQNLQDPVNPQDAVNLQTLRREIERIVVGSAQTAAGRPAPFVPGAPAAPGAPAPTPPPAGPVAPPTPVTPFVPPPSGPPAPAGPPPSPGSRDAACMVNCSMQGLTVTTGQYGNLPYYEAIISWLNAADRQACYTAKKAIGNTHCGIVLSGQYASSGQAYTNIPGKDLSQDLGTLSTLIIEIITAGFVPILFLAGDGIGAGPGYNDPLGWTYGWQWLMNNLGRVVAALQTSSNGDLTNQILFSPGFDGVFYGWGVPGEVPDLQPSRVQQFGALFRSLLPNGYLAIEHGIGTIPVGGGPADYNAGGPMRNYDVILSEFDPWAGLHVDSCWQVAGRLLGPAWRRPPPSDMPPADDPNPPFYLQAGTPRGQYYTCGFEFDTYNWVRNKVSAADVVNHRQYLQSLGYSSRILG